MEQVPTILGALILAAVLWVMKTTNETAKDVAVLKANAASDGAELTRVRDRMHTMSDILNHRRGAEDLAEALGGAIAEALDRRGAT